MLSDVQQTLCFALSWKETQSVIVTLLCWRLACKFYLFIQGDAAHPEENCLTLARSHERSGSARRPGTSAFGWRQWWTCAIVIADHH